MLSKDYILGFVEGEGCFSIAIGKNIDRRKRKTNRVNKIKNPHLFRVSPTFRINNIISNIQLLEEIKDTLKVGSIRTTQVSQTRKTSQDIATYYTKSFSEALAIQEFFKDLKFETTKGKDFESWCKCIEIIKNKEHTTKEGILKICDIRDKMNKRDSKGKWNKEEVEKILNNNPTHIKEHFDTNQSYFIHNNNFDNTHFLKKQQGNNKRQIIKTTNS
jgi:hypothetical protein